MTAFEKIVYWDMVPHPNNEPVLNNSFLLRRKRSVEDEVSKYKSLLVVSGNEEDDTEEDTYSPVPDFKTINLLMCIATQNHWKKRHLFFKNAFPHGILRRDVYVKPPSCLYSS